MNSLTKISVEPKVAKNAIDVVSRINPKFHFPGDMQRLEKNIRFCLALPIHGKVGGQLPYAYTYNAANDTYEPHKEVFALLWQARRYLYTSSLREVADWLNLKTSKLGYTQNISHMGLRNLMVMRPPMEECLMPDAEKEKLIESIVAWNKIQKTE